LSEEYAPIANSKSAEAMKEALTETNGGPILAAWESMNTQTLLYQLGVPDAPWWPYCEPTVAGNCQRTTGLNSCETEYNRVYEILFSPDPNSESGWTFHSYQNLTQGLPCLAQKLATSAERAGLDWPLKNPYPIPAYTALFENSSSKDGFQW